MNDQRLIELLVKKHAGELSLPEQRELFELEKAQADNAMTSTLVAEVFRSQTNFDLSVSPQNQKEAFVLISERINQPDAQIKSGKLRLLTPFKMVAAAVLLIAVVSTLFWVFNSTSKSAAGTQQIVSTEKGSKTKVVLPDGTQVWLNADTKLNYAASFGTDSREVTLVGEAYFDVVKDKSRPFIVHTKTMDVKVLGTAFNVRSYENEATAQTTLIRGKVDVILRNQDGQKISLNPNEKVVVRNSRKNKALSSEKSKNSLNEDVQPLFVKTDLNPVDSSVYETGWVNNRLVFRRENFEEIIATLERWYNVKIIVKRIPENKKFRGTFQNDSLEDVLKAFQASVGINFKIEKDHVTIF